MKLYIVKLQGLSSLNNFYVIAENTDEAYRKVRTWLDNKDIGLKREFYEYADCRTRLFL